VLVIINQLLYHYILSSFCLLILHPPRSTLFPYTTLFRSEKAYHEGDIAFLGTFRPVRADFLAEIVALTNGLRFNIWGGGWHKMDRPTYWHKKGAWRDLRSCVRMRELWCSAMGTAIQSNKIILGLLNHANRDLHTSRSSEIPACCVCMLAT